MAFLLLEKSRLRACRKSAWRSRRVGDVVLQCQWFPAARLAGLFLATLNGMRARSAEPGGLSAHGHLLLDLSKPA
jgi:hypothetical protein